MEHFAGIDVSLEQSSACVVDGAGKIVREAKVASEPEALVGFFCGLKIEGQAMRPEARQGHSGAQAGDGPAIACGTIRLTQVPSIEPGPLLRVQLAACHSEE
jgi:hypothetical protein